MPNRLITPEQAAKEFADAINHDLESLMSSEDRANYVRGLNEWARQFGGFPLDESQ